MKVKKTDIQDDGLASQVAEIVADAYNSLNQLQPTAVTAGCYKILTAFDYHISQQELADPGELHVAELQDGSVLLEWIFEDRRLTFALETNISESSWNYLTTPRYGNTYALGDKPIERADNILRMVLGDLGAEDSNSYSKRDKK